MFGYAFVYSGSRLKETLMDPIWSPLTIDPNK
jgi:hypothetical protein